MIGGSYDKQQPWTRPAKELGMMRRAGAILAFVVGALVGLVGGAALLAYAYQEAGLYPPDDATIKFIAQERGWLNEAASSDAAA
jgi:hypothetical protein